MDAFEVLHTRRSIRQFLNRPVGEDLVKELLSAAMSAPTAGGIQPWRFVVITDREKLDKIPDFHSAICAATGADTTLYFAIAAGSTPIIFALACSQ